MASKNFKEHDNNNGYSTFIKKGCKWQDIKYKKDGTMYVVYQGRRLNLDDFVWHPSCQKYIMGLTYDSCYTLELDDHAEKVKVGYEYTGRATEWLRAINRAGR